MKTFRCACGNTLYFENHQCLVCGRTLGFLPEQGVLSALEQKGDSWESLHVIAAGLRFRKCRNYEQENVLYLNGERCILKITSAAYFTPSGRCIERRIPIPYADPAAIGIMPDFLVEDPDPTGHALEVHIS